jgi:hypothetical protein
MAFDSISQQDVVHTGNSEKSYQAILLKHVLSYAPDKGYKIKSFGQFIPKIRAFNLMATDGGIDVMIGTATKERAALYQPIHFPILKGLNGLRIPLINRDTPELFAKVRSLKSLKQLKLGQFHTWTDVKILETNDFNVIKGSNFLGLFQMLDKKRIDYLPQSILDVERDLKNQEHLGIMAAPYILIRYPSAYYFYVRKDNHPLANDIRQGLEKSLADGSFDKIFYAYYGDVLKKQNYKNRFVFELDNPFLLDSLPRDRKELWLQ